MQYMQSRERAMQRAQRGRAMGLAIRWLSVGAIGCVSAPLVGAQQAPDMQEIVVTATKRESVLKDTSESLSVLSSERLADTGATDFESYVRFVPGLAQSSDLGPGNKRYSLRGISSGGEPLVGVYYDEIPALGSPGESLDAGGSQPDIKLWDVERIEVLRGPQGTLYGSGSMGGTIRVISARPDAKAFSATAEGSWTSPEGGSNGYSAKAMINAPLITDQLAVRLTGYKFDEAGWIDEVFLGAHDVNSAHTDGGRLGVRWTPNERLSFTSTTYLQNATSGGTSEAFEGYTSGDELRAGNLVRQPFEDRLRMTNFVTEYRGDHADILYSFAYQDRKVTRSIDQTRFAIFGLAGVPPAVCPDSALADGSCYAMVNSGPFGTVVPLVSYGVETNVARTHELRATSAGSGPIHWTGGLYYESRDTSRDGQVAVTDANGYLAFLPDGTAEGRVYSRANSGTREQKAAFGEIDYELAPGWTATGGIRWAQSNQTQRQRIIQNFGPGPVGPQPEQSASSDNTVGRIKLGWQASKQLLLYGLVSQGFRPGGPNQPVGFNASAPDFRSDKLLNSELGGKWQSQDGRLYVEADAFRIDWSNMQFVTTDSTGAFTLIGNAGDAVSSGAEARVSARVAEGWTVDVASAYNRARFTGPQPAQGLLVNQTESGDRLPGVPDWTGVVSLDHAQPWSTWTVQEGIDWSYTGDRVIGFRPEAGNFRSLPAISSFNARIGLTNEKYAVWLRGYNLSNNLDPVTGRIELNTPFRYSTLRPRTLELSLQVRF